MPILALSAGSRLATVAILTYLLMRNGIPHTNHQTRSFSKTLINFSYGSSPLARAGVQFSKTLIDFQQHLARLAPNWGSVLKNPDRLRKKFSNC
ncbi:Conserved hypothetical protein [Corynebacterium diphtheriae]|uniref:Uncharacterized protein n=1 Tax=Corynebacterium diphtheriae (strain ATCC 700971 / NCTC 13129 / Biotype gravis) TaxID=257309 RepID=Q6NKH9_CORDI|nr:Conserved hypothetical protein [Corynebacterium diphtheriae]